MSEWIEWKGGEWNGDPDARVTVRVRCGQEETGTASGVVATWRRSTEPGAQHRENYDVTHYRLIEPQQETEPKQVRQHVSDAAYEAYKSWSKNPLDRDDYSLCHAQMGTILLTVAEHDELLAKIKLREEQWRFADDEHRKERDALRAEVKRLTSELRLQDQANDILTRDNEPLRKGRDDERRPNYMGKGRMIADTMTVDLLRGRDDARVDSVVSSRGGASLCAVFQTLDHRLGTRQPDGEPCEPMSSYSWKRGLGS